MSRTNWDNVASLLAREAGTNWFESRWGVRYLEDLDVVCVFNNHPYANYPHAREQEIATFRSKLAEAGIKELACATYPPAGEEGAGYTFAMVLDASRDRQDWIRECWSDIRSETFTKLLKEPETTSQ